MRWLGFSLAFGAALSSARPAAAAPLVVDWQAPTCAEQGAFLSRVRDALGREPETLLADELRVRVSIREDAEQSRFSLEVETDAGARQLELPSCDEAVAAAATFVALTIDPSAARATAAGPSPAPAIQSEPTRPARQFRPVRVAIAGEQYLGPLVGVSLGELPRASPLLGARVGRRWRTLDIGLEAFWIAPQTELLSGTEKGGAVGLWGGGPSACYLLPRGEVGVSGCLGVEAGAWRSRGVGVTAPTERSDWWLAGMARLWASARLSAALRLSWSADLIVPARRPWFSIEGLGRVFRPKVVAERFSAGLELSF